MIFDGTIVSGIYAELVDGSYIQVSAKAVVLATGDFGCNDKLLGRRGLRYALKAGTIPLYREARRF